MPLHTYRCTACDHIFETLVNASDTPACPSCGSAALERQLSKPGVFEGKVRDTMNRAIRQAKREGHFSNY